jgi:hypothetical protein
MPERWLLITVTTAETPASLRVQAWRSLRALGAHYLKPSVCLLPQRPAVAEALQKLAARVERQGGHARVFEIGRLDDRNEQAVVRAFSAERKREYEQLIARARELLDEIRSERTRGCVTYTELEQSDVDLRRFEQWLASIRRRDWFDAPAHADAVAVVEECRRALAGFEAEAFAGELSSTKTGATALVWRDGLGVFARTSD